MTRDPLDDARSAGLSVEIADLGDWAPASLVSEYDQEACAIRVNARVLEHVRAHFGAAVGDGLLKAAVAHELYHHEVASGTILPQRDRAATERAAEAFALCRHGLAPPRALALRIARIIAVAVPAVCASLSLSALPSMAQAPAPANPSTTTVEERVDRLARSFMRKDRLPGMTVAVVRSGQPQLERAYGLADVELAVAVTPDILFQSGSVGKMFTAALVVLLSRDARFGLDDRIRRYLPEASTRWDAITIRQLLTHTAGLSDKAFDTIDLRRDYTDVQLLRRYSAAPLASIPGTKWSYSNIGYETLGFLIDRVTHRFYGDLLRERIFEPAGMSTARIIDEAAIIPHRAAGYRLVKGRLLNQEYVSPSLNRTADGSLLFSLHDLVKWDAALYATTPLGESIKRTIWTPVKLKSGSSCRYGFGWFLDSVRGHRIVQHDGVWQGFTDEFVRYPDDRLAVIVQTNLEDAPGIERFAHEVAALFVPALAPERVTRRRGFCT